MLRYQTNFLKVSPKKKKKNPVPFCSPDKIWQSLKETRQEWQAAVQRFTQKKILIKLIDDLFSFKVVLLKAIMVGCLTEAVCLVGKGSLWAAGQTLAFVQLEARPTLGAEVPAETVLTVQRATLWEDRDHRRSSQQTIWNSCAFSIKLVLEETSIS